jgi:hypothetical protein
MSKAKLHSNLTGKRYGRRPNADSQCGCILARLQQGPATSDQLRDLNIRDVTTRIWDLRNLWGIAIRTDQDAGSGIATYSLAMEPLGTSHADVTQPVTPRADDWYERATGNARPQLESPNDFSSLPLFTKGQR